MLEPLREWGWYREFSSLRVLRLPFQVILTPIFIPSSLGNLVELPTLPRGTTCSKMRR